MVRPLDVAMYWIEYVLRHQGKQFKSPFLELYWFQIHFLDVVVFFLSFILVTCSFLKYVIFFLIGVFNNRNQKDQEQVRKNKKSAVVKKNSTTKVKKL